MKKELESLLRKEFNIAEEDTIVDVKVFTSQVVSKEFSLLEPTLEWGLNAVPAVPEEKKPKRKYTPRKPKKEKKAAAAPAKKKGGRRGRKPAFDMDITTVHVAEAKATLQKLYDKDKMSDMEKNRYENLCWKKDVRSLTVGDRDKVIALYKDVGRRVTGGEE